MKRPKILLITESYPWMGPNSGLVPLVHELARQSELEVSQASGVLEDAFKGILGKLKRKIWYRFPNRSRLTMLPYASCQHYGYGDYTVERSVVKTIASQKPDLVHHLFADTRHGYIASFCERNSIPFVATIHKPRSFRKLVGFDYKFLKKAASIITVGPDEKSEFDSVNQGNVHFIPHGVSLNFFKPALASPANSEPYTCITAGNHLRDYPLLLKTIRLVLQRDPSVCFKIIIPIQKRNSGVFEELAVIPQVTFHSNISDSELVRVYQSSHCLLLPLIDCTANNTLLEAMACGLPIITTDLPGTRAYTNKKFAALYPAGEAVSLADAVMDLKTDHERSVLASAESRIHAESSFDWSVIADSHSKLYHKILNDPGAYFGVQKTNNLENSI